MRGVMPTILALMCVGLSPASAADADGERGREPQSKTFEKQITITVKLNYLLYLPEGYETADKEWPLILFLHGAGDSGNDLSRVRRAGLPPVVERKEDFPFLVVAPQSPGRGWNPETLGALLDEVVAQNRVDKDRIYLTGLSMGGFGTWSLAAAHPERFAAIAPICGGGDPKQAGRLKGLPIWAFHGAKDPTVPLERSEEMVRAIKEAGGDVRFTVYPEAKHDAWTETYNNPELYEWFLQHRRGATEP